MLEVESLLCMEEPRSAFGVSRPVPRTQEPTVTAAEPLPLDDSELLQQLFAHFGSMPMVGKENRREGPAARRHRALS